MTQLIYELSLLKSKKKASLLVRLILPFTERGSSFFLMASHLASSSTLFHSESLKCDNSGYSDPQERNVSLCRSSSPSRLATSFFLLADGKNRLESLTNITFLMCSSRASTRSVTSSRPPLVEDHLAELPALHVEDDEHPIFANS